MLFIGWNMSDTRGRRFNDRYRSRSCSRIRVCNCFLNRSRSWSRCGSRIQSRLRRESRHLSDVGNCDDRSCHRLGRSPWPSHSSLKRMSRTSSRQRMPEVDRTLHTVLDTVLTRLSAVEKNYSVNAPTNNVSSGGNNTTVTPCTFGNNPEVPVSNWTFVTGAQYAAIISNAQTSGSQIN